MEEQLRKIVVSLSWGKKNPLVTLLRNKVFNFVKVASEVFSTECDWQNYFLIVAICRRTKPPLNLDSKQNGICTWNKNHTGKIVLTLRWNATNLRCVGNVWLERNTSVSVMSLPDRTSDWRLLNRSTKWQATNKNVQNYFSSFRLQKSSDKWQEISFDEFWTQLPFAAKHHGDGFIPVPCT